MRALASALVLLFIAALFAPGAIAEDFGAVSKVTALLPIEETPQLAPGGCGQVRFRFNSTYTEEIRAVRLNASIYRYATIEESIPVDASWPYRYPMIVGTGDQTWNWTAAMIAPGQVVPLSFTICTAADSRDMPHGSVFSQASYFIRFWLEFEGNDTSGNSTRFRMASPGFFSRERWDQARAANATSPCRPPSCRGSINLTILGVDGVLADTAFGVKEPIPQWPFYGLIAAAVVFLVFAFLFWVEENPGTYPRIERSWARTRGRLVRTFAILRRRRRPSEGEKGF